MPILFRFFNHNVPMNTLFQHPQWLSQTLPGLCQYSSFRMQLQFYKPQTCDRLWARYQAAESTGRRLHSVPHRQLKQSIRPLCKDAPARHYSCFQATSSSTRTNPAPLYSAQRIVIARDFSLTTVSMALKQGEFVGSLDCGTT